MSEIVLVRGLPGSGKSTLASNFMDGTDGVVVSADDWFVGSDGVYRFDPKGLPEAHGSCLKNSEAAILAGLNVIVANTFSCKWEMKPYFDMAGRRGARMRVIDLYDAGLTDEKLADRNTHGVPIEVIKRMRDRWEHDTSGWEESV